jgi:soluble lytic murein transglycosylase-like protein
MKTFALLFLAALPLAAGEIVILTTGYRIEVKKIERVDEKMRLYTGQGVIEVAPESIAAIELDERFQPPPAPPAPAAVDVAPPPPRNPRQMVSDAAAKHGLPPAIVHAVASVESAYQTNALSPKGAIGVMQLMPDTARTLGADPNDVQQNIEAGARLLRDLLVKYENDPNPVRRALAAYNAGSGAVDRYNGVPPYRETQLYVDKVIERYWKNSAQPVTAAVAAAPAAPVPPPALPAR